MHRIGFQERPQNSEKQLQLRRYWCLARAGTVCSGAWPPSYFAGRTSRILKSLGGPWENLRYSFTELHIHLPGTSSWTWLKKLKRPSIRDQAIVALQDLLEEAQERYVQADLEATIHKWISSPKLAEDGGSGGLLVGSNGGEPKVIFMNKKRGRRE